MKLFTPGQVWPDHAGHEIRYSEYGRTDYIVTSLADNNEGTSHGPDYIVENYDNRPCDGDVQETEFWCRDCGVVLRSDS